MEKEIRKVTELNKEELLALQVAENQQHYIESVNECLVEASETPEFIAVGLYKDNIAVGFAMYGKFQEENEEVRIWLDRYLIDKRYQQRGLGKYFLTRLIDYLADTYHCHSIYLSVYESNRLAINMYKSFGFAFNGERDINGEKVMVKHVE